MRPIDALNLYDRYFSEFNAMDLAVQQMNNSMSSMMSMLFTQ